MRPAAEKKFHESEQNDSVPGGLHPLALGGAVGLQAKIYVNLRGSPSNERASMIPFLGDIVSITALCSLARHACRASSAFK